MQVAEVTRESGIKGNKGKEFSDEEVENFTKKGNKKVER